MWHCIAAHPLPGVTAASGLEFQYTTARGERNHIANNASVPSTDTCTSAHDKALPSPPVATTEGSDSDDGRTTPSGQLGDEQLPASNDGAAESRDGESRSRLAKLSEQEDKRLARLFTDKARPWAAQLRSAFKPPGFDDGPMDEEEYLMSGALCYEHPAPTVQGHPLASVGENANDAGMAQAAGENGS